MKGISGLLITALVVSAYGGSLGKSESFENLQQENEISKEKLLSVLCEIEKVPQTTNDIYKQFLTDSENHEVENDDKNNQAWGPGIPSNIISLIKKYKQSLPKEDDPCKKNQSKEEDSDDTKDNEDSNEKDIDRENSHQIKNESPIKSRQRKSASIKDKDSSDEDDDSNSSDDNSSDEKFRPSHPINSDESNSDDKSDESNSKKSKENIDDDLKNSIEVNKWKWILNRGYHQARNSIPAPWNWAPEYNWELEAKRGELKSRLIRIVQLNRVIKSLKTLTEEFNKRGQWEKTSGLIKAIMVHKKLLGENILAVSRICNITEVEPHQISELIINCTISYYPQWRNQPNVERPILENNKPALNNNITLREFLVPHSNLNQSNIILQLLNAIGLKDKAIIEEGEQQMNGIISWHSQADKSKQLATATKILRELYAILNNNQISTTAESPTDDTSSQTGPTTSQSEQSSNNSENTDTENPSSTSASSPEETTQNAHSESESIFNTTASTSTSLNNE